MDEHGTSEREPRLLDFNRWLLLMMVLGAACLIALALMALIVWGDRLFLE